MKKCKICGKFKLTQEHLDCGVAALKTPLPVDHSVPNKPWVLKPYITQEKDK